MARFSGFLRNPFSFLFAKTQKEELIAQYVIREHHRGRSLAEILEDAYVTNRCTPEQVKRLLDRPDVIQAVGDDTVGDVKTQIAPES